MFGIKLIVLLIVLSGFLAYLGDVLGRRIGRKKLTLFGLRPKYTAVLVTIFTGALITLFTMMFMILLSQNMQDALFHLDSIKKELKRTKQLSAAQKKEISRRAREIGKISEKIQQERVNLTRVEEKLNVTSLEKRKVEKTYLNIKSLFEKTQTNLGRSKKMLTSLKSSQKVLHGQVSGLKNRKQELETKISRLRSLGDSVFTQLVQTRQELEKLQKIELNLEHKAGGKIIFASGELLGQVVIPEKTSRADVEKNIVATLQEINAHALDAGSKGAREGEGLNVYQEEWDKLLNDLKELPEPKLVRFLAKDNTVEGEGLKLKFSIIPNKKIFSKGEILVEETVQPGLDEKGVEAALLAIFQKAREKALAGGLLTGPEGAVGGVTALRFYEVIGILRAIQSPAKVQVFTVKDIYTGGPLAVDLKVVHH